jgi:hypothetical protein
VGATLLDGLIVLALNLPTVCVALAVATGGGLQVHTTVTGHATFTLSHEMKVVAVIAGLAYLVSVLLYAPLLLRREGRHNGQTWGSRRFRSGSSATAAHRSTWAPRSCARSWPSS